MVALRLTTRDRETLGHSARHSTDAREARRPLALLDLDAGEARARVAERYGVSRSTVYEWVARWRDTNRPRADRLRDAARSGRPPDTRDAAEEALAGLMPTAPTAHGYRQPAHRQGVPAAGGRPRGRVAVPADGVPGVEPGGGAVAARQGAGAGERADPRPGRQPRPGVRGAVRDDRDRTTPAGRSAVRKPLATY